MTDLGGRPGQASGGRELPTIPQDPAEARRLLDDNHTLRQALLDFIADFANWDNSTVPAYLDTSRALTQAAHEALGGAPGTRPLVVDPFAGGGSIPLEALRVGADAFASDLNPVPVLLNKVVLEYIPKYGQRLADEVRKWGEWIKQRSREGTGRVLSQGCRRRDAYRLSLGADDSMRRPRLRRGSAAHPLAVASQESQSFRRPPTRAEPKAKRVDFQIIVKQRDGWVDQADPKIKIEKPKFDGTVKRGSATCPCCGYTTPVARVREQFKVRRGGANDSRLLCVVTIRTSEQGRFYRLPTDADLRAVAKPAPNWNAEKRPTKGHLLWFRTNQFRRTKCGASAFPSTAWRRGAMSLATVRVSCFKRSPDLVAKSASGPTQA